MRHRRRAPISGIMKSSQAENINELRTRIRKARRALTPEQQAEAARGLLENLLCLHSFRSARRVACYLANDGEIDSSLAIDWLEMTPYLSPGVYTSRVFDQDGLSWPGEMLEGQVEAVLGQPASP